MIFKYLITYIFCALLIFLSGLSFKASAQTPSSETDLFSLSIQELIDIEIDIASNDKKGINEQPSVITLITRSTIESSGARYLKDLLKQVPGFWIGTDTLGTFSVSFRGIWGMEAKILLIIDGIEQNEMAFGSLVLGNRYPVSNISQVEIIRGPGSVKYGGQAALAVIRVTTLNQATGDNKLNLMTDIGKSGFHNGIVGFTHSGEVTLKSSQLEYGLSGSLGDGDYSNATWQALDGYQFNLQNNSNSQPTNLSMNLRYNGWDLNAQYEKLKQEDRLLFGDSGLFFSPNQRYTQANELTFLHQAISLGKEWQLNDKLALSSKLTYTNQKPWNSQGQYGHDLSRKINRSRVDVQGLYALTDNSSLLIGSHYYYEKAEVSQSYIFDPTVRYFGSNNASNNDYSLYAQYESDWDFANVLAGIRYENHDLAGPELVPRLSLTKTWDKIHTKLIYNEAFKIPQFDTVASAHNAGTPILDPETTKSWEMETGYQLTETASLVGNLYLLQVDNFIGFNPQSASNTTLGDFRTMGMELQLKWQLDKLHVNANYSYFTVEKSNIDSFTIPLNKDAVLGIPNHMFKADLHYRFTANSRFHLLGRVVSGQYACTNDPNFICGEPEKLDTIYDVDAFYQYRTTHTLWNFGIKNLFNSNVYAVQPFKGGQSPINYESTRVMLDFQYSF